MLGYMQNPALLHTSAVFLVLNVHLVSSQGTLEGQTPHRSGDLIHLHEVS